LLLWKTHFKRRLKMSANLFKTMRTGMFITAISVWSIGGFTMSAYAQSCCSSMQHDGGNAGHQHGSVGNDNAAKEQAVVQPPHDGQVTKMEPLTFEVVYYPQEIRIYIYGFMPYPESAKEAQGEVVMQVRGNPQVFRAPLVYVAPPAGSREQDYLAAPVDFTHIRDGDMQVTLNLENLPLPHRPKVAFTQTFALTKAKPKVSLAALVEADRAGIAQQKVCPVTGAKLGSMGAPIKVLVGDQPLYLCCQGCLGQVESTPEKYLAKVNQSPTNH
jgi:hypothetical protein